MRLIQAALKYRQVVFALTAFAVILGVQALLGMPRREDPKITIRQGLVIAAYPGASARQVEEQVARKIEAELFRHPEVRKTKTFATARDGVVIFNVELEPAVTQPDEFWAMLRHDLNEVRATELPPGVVGPIVNADFGDVAVALISVRGERYEPRELADFLDRIEDAVRTLPEVSKLDRFGEQAEELRITTSNARLAALGVSAQQVTAAIQQRNAVVPAGTVETPEGAALAVRGQGQLATAEELRRLLVGTSRDGRPVYLGDVARVERRFTENPSLIARVDGEPSVMMTVEMREGENIVRFGEAVEAKIEQVRATLPPDVEVDVLANQPEVVAEAMSHFGREFVVALGAVVLVTVLLLPLRIAAIAAVAIPVTVAATLAILNAVGIELHNMTFAGLVVALGIVVDDAIVIADNYIEKLDHGVTPWEAAWRAPRELAIPVLTATLTIVASFLPLAFLAGTAGEYVRVMPLTVSIALLTSYVVAMLLTPVLCLMFAKKGLHAAAPDAAAASGRKRRTPLDLMQAAYDRTIALAMPRPVLVLAGAALSFVLGVFLMTRVANQFFPFMERDQFVVDVWMPEGTRLEAVDSTLAALKTVLEREADVEWVASFAGQSAPRFVTTLDPEPPTPNYGQLLVKTASSHATPELVRSLWQRLGDAAPEAAVYVKQLQSGPPLKAPIEVRLVGEDPAQLTAWEDSVRAILEGIPGSAYVHSDWRGDVYALDLTLREEVARRLGLSYAAVSQQLYAGLTGAPISTFFEGSRRVDIVFSLDDAERRGAGDVLSAYVVSPATGAAVPVRQVAEVTPSWQSARIVRRNGERTLTVRVFTQPGVLTSPVLKPAQAALAELRLPEGVRMEWGGELEASAEVQGSVNRALGISMVAIYLILLFQFRNSREPLIVMVSIPLALAGAALGLQLTGNPFTYTANIGINALTGIVVRNAIILVDYANELRGHGMSVREAAMNAGRRRLRPIFLTTMAAAVGVTPMMATSVLWSPMASVIAVGLVVSMFFTLIVVPVLYRVVEERKERAEARKAARHDGAALPAGGLAGAVAAPAVALLLMMGAAPAVAQAPSSAVAPAAGTVEARPGVRRLTLDEAVALALRDGTAARIAQARVAEAGARRSAARADYFPVLGLSATYTASSSEVNITVPQGVLGEDATGRPIPFTDRTFSQGGGSVLYGTATVQQGLTSVLRVRQAEGIARARVAELEAERARTELDVALGVERLYLGLLIARKQAESADASLAARRQQAVDAEGAVARGTALAVQASSARAGVLEADYQRIAAQDRIEDLELELTELLGLPAGTALELEAPARPAALASLESYQAAARDANPEIRAAAAQAEQARRGVTLARQAWLPDLGVQLTYTYQDAVPFLPDRIGSVAVQGSWNPWDWGKRNATIRERRAGLATAELNVLRLRERAAVQVEQAYRRAARAQRAADAAWAAFEARREALRVAEDQHGRGMVQLAVRTDAEAALKAAEAQALAAQLDARIARAELVRAVGVR